MADDEDEVGEETPFDPTFATAGPRRSTFTPPPASVQRPAGEDGTTGDDALADALAAEYTRLGSGTIQLPPEPEPAEAADTSEPPSHASHAAATPPPAEPAPWSSAPAPDPAHAVPLESPFAQPVRRSLPDEELVRWVEEAGKEPGSTLEVIEKLEAQLRLREDEAKQFQAWEARMHSLGPDAAAVVEGVRPEFPGDLPELPVPPGFGPPAPESRVAADEPVVEPPAPPPVWDVPAPSASWAPAPDYEPAEAAFEPVVEATIEPGPDETPSSVSPAAPVEDVVPPPLVEPPPFGAPPADAFSFDDLLSGTPQEQSVASAEPIASPGHIDPLPVSAAEPIPTGTGSVSIVETGLDRDVEDDVDETDRVDRTSAGAIAVDAVGNAVVAELIAPPSGPISTVRVPEDEQVLVDDELARRPVFGIESVGEQPTPLDHRIGRAARLFWLWFAPNSSIVSLGLGAAVFAVGMSLRQSIVAILAGVAVSFIPLGLTTLAGKRSGQPTMVLSRATFGVLGNLVPAILALVTRVFWGAVLLWLLGSAVAIVLVGAGLDGALGERMILLISLGAAFLVAALVAFAGYSLLARIQLVLSVLSGALVVGLIVMTAGYVDLAQALTVPDGPWLLTITGAVLVFSFVGLVWANSGADLARYQRTGSSSASSMLWATFGATLPAFLLIGYGALLAASNEAIATGFLQSPLDTLALMLPLWYPVPLIAATSLSLLSGITITLYSGSFALQAIGVRVPRQVGVLIVAALLGALALLLVFGVSGGIVELFRDAATTLAVPTAAWAGLFAAETMIRDRRFDSESLVTRGGVYADVRWGNLIALLAITAIGFAFTSATIGWLSWQGYGFSVLGMPIDGDLAGTDVGVLIALVLGLLVPIVFGIPAIRRQEAAKA